MEKDKDLERKHYIDKYQPFYNNINKYLKNYVIPEVAAFYLASSFNYNCLGKHNLINHLNSILNLFNTNININDILPLIINILNIKYNLKIIKTNPLKLKKNF